MSVRDLSPKMNSLEWRGTVEAFGLSIAIWNYPAPFAFVFPIDSLAQRCGNAKKLVEVLALTVSSENMGNVEQ